MFQQTFKWTDATKSTTSYLLYAVDKNMFHL